MAREECGGVEQGLSLSLFSFLGGWERREAETQFLISRKLLSLISVIRFREDFVFFKGFTNWIT